MTSERATAFPIRRLAVAAAAVAAVAAAVLWYRQGSGPAPAVEPTFAARRGPLTISVTETGTIRPRDQIVIKSQMEGRTTILYLVPEGTVVRRGDLLVELDASNLQDARVDQQIQVQNSEAALVRAREVLEVTRNQAASDTERAELEKTFAEQDLVKYREGEYPRKVSENEARIALAQEEVKRTEEKLSWSRVLLGEKYLSQTEAQADELAARKARLDLELAQGDLVLLNSFTHPRTLADLESKVRQTAMALERTRRKAAADVVQGEAELRARQSEYDRERSKLEKLERQIANARILAPGEGLVVYATSGQFNFGRNAEPLAAGQEVTEQQELITLPTSDTFQAEVKVHESHLDKVRLGLPVEVTVDAMPNRVFQGRVTRIAPLPDASSVFLNPDLKVYTTEVLLEGAEPGLRNGMSCRAELVLERYPDVLHVPVQAVLRVQGRPTVWVRSGDGWAPRDVRVGLDNDRMVVVESGLAEGEEVLLAPPLSAGERREGTEPSTSPATGERPGGGGRGGSPRPAGDGGAR